MRAPAGTIKRKSKSKIKTPLPLPFLIPPGNITADLVANSFCSALYYTPSLKAHPTSGDRVLCLTPCCAAISLVRQRAASTTLPRPPRRSRWPTPAGGCSSTWVWSRLRPRLLTRVYCDALAAWSATGVLLALCEPADQCPLASQQEPSTSCLPSSHHPISRQIARSILPERHPSA